MLLFRKEKRKGFGVVHENLSDIRQGPLSPPFDLPLTFTVSIVNQSTLSI